MIEPLRMSFDVACGPEDAFQLWTQRTRAWWPSVHTVTAEPGVQVIFESKRGGRIFERAPSGREVEWGEVTVWQPPERLCYLWHIRVDRADATEVEIRFTAIGRGTRVEIEHRGWERLGARGPAWRRTNQSGWNAVLPDYRSVCASVTPPGSAEVEADAAES
jgi:hypothetical protein